jgi:quercetin dioxygenase-like cupin family protein
VAERELTKERLNESEIDPKLYYDYEGRFIMQNLEKEHVMLLPRVLKPALFARGGHALGDLRVFERYLVGPLSMITCSFLGLAPNGRTEKQRMLPSQVAYVLEGSGESVQDGARHPFVAGDVVLVPPYTTSQWSAGPAGLRLWLPQVRMWHVLGLLWLEQQEFQKTPAGTEPLHDAAGALVGFRVPAGVLGLERPLEVRDEKDPRRDGFFSARRRVTSAPPPKTRYDRFVSMLVSENEIERRAPRVISVAKTPLERTRQGITRWYVTRWSEAPGQALDLMTTEIEAGGHSGEHRHVFEELIYVKSGRGHDVHGDTEHPWEAGDLVCVPPMTAHRHHADGSDTAVLVSVWPKQLGHEYLGGIEHLADASAWKARGGA